MLYILVRQVKASVDKLPVRRCGQGTIEVAFKVVEKVNADSCYHLFLENFTDGVRALLSFAQCKVGGAGIE